MEFIHKELASGKWFNLSLCEQLGNIGSEISRAIKWKNKNHELYENAVFRALELIDITLMDKRWTYRLKEITRLREMIGDAYSGGIEFGSTFPSIEIYLMPFAISARAKLNDIV
jgi:hypothetical protein